jgi:hypothetical protein
MAMGKVCEELHDSYLLEPKGTRKV